jgi:hypothetical protein
VRATEKEIQDEEKQRLKQANQGDKGNTYYQPVDKP